jgi:hypothetical protein
LQESLAVAVKTGAMKPQDTRRVIVDTTVQPKNRLTDAMGHEPGGTVGTKLERGV